MGVLRNHNQQKLFEKQAAEPREGGRSEGRPGVAAVTICTDQNQLFQPAGMRSTTPYSQGSSKGRR